MRLDRMSGAFMHTRELVDCPHPEGLDCIQSRPSLVRHECFELLRHQLRHTGGISFHSRLSVADATCSRTDNMSSIRKEQMAQIGPNHLYEEAHGYLL